ncbi:hypothetical protein E2562_032272 [Oryza meyeriana var. granulata]|uniref:Uncharacterized protein n=1 Tax=Oryza meyeriana var. granulata TaxID=110450 RepID=A0A6G1F0N4_9ORYZ|nr:hypothetical protein E2562_032272 [Oryza meyeriana var. granulata]
MVNAQITTQSSFVKRLPLIKTDSRNIIVVTMVAEELIGVPALTLVASVQGLRDLVPMEIARLYRRQLIVKVNASRRSLQMSRISY